MTLPNFLMIGAAKSGTSSIEQYLAEHPQIYISSGLEMNFFAFEGEQLNFQGPKDSDYLTKITITNLEEYKTRFKDVSDEIAIGEKSTWYLYSPKAIKRIQHYIPEVKLIAILRNPVDRAYSSFLHLVRDYREPLLDFEKALEAEEKRIRENWEYLWYYKKAGFYGEQLQRYFERFSPKQIYIGLYEDLKQNPAQLIQDIFRFLEVDENFTPNLSKKYNVSSGSQSVSRVPKNKTWHKFLSQSNPIKSILKPLIPSSLRNSVREDLKQRNLGQPSFKPEIRRQLIEIYRQDIIKLEGLIQRDLSQWLEP